MFHTRHFYNTFLLSCVRIYIFISSSLHFFYSFIGLQDLLIYSVVCLSIHWVTFFSHHLWSCEVGLISLIIQSYRSIVIQFVEGVEDPKLKDFLLLLKRRRFRGRDLPTSSSARLNFESSESWSCWTVYNSLFDFTGQFACNFESILSTFHFNLFDFSSFDFLKLYFNLNYNFLWKNFFSFI